VTSHYEKLRRCGDGVLLNKCGVGFACLLPLPGLPIEPQESPLKIFDMAAVGTLLIIAEVIIDSK
jgi:hypothetical protein